MIARTRQPLRAACPACLVPVGVACRALSEPERAEMMALQSYPTDTECWYHAGRVTAATQLPTTPGHVAPCPSLGAPAGVGAEAGTGDGADAGAWAAEDLVDALRARAERAEDRLAGAIADATATERHLAAVQAEHAAALDSCAGRLGAIKRALDEAEAALADARTDAAHVAHERDLLAETAQHLTFELLAARALLTAARTVAAAARETIGDALAPMPRDLPAVLAQVTAQPATPRPAVPPHWACITVPTPVPTRAPTPASPSARPAEP